MVDKQNKDGCANNICKLLQQAMHPTRHLSNQAWYSDKLSELNTLLMFLGFKLGENGKLETADRVETIAEVNAKTKRLKESLSLRNVHPDVLLFCRDELLVDNYFHAVFEATKSIAEKIREKTNLSDDGADLVDKAFSFKGKVPYLALNSLQTKNEESEQRGFMNILKGMFSMFRNTTAHIPKITWKIDELDALDILSMVSLAHRRLDNSVEAKKMYESRV